MLQVHASEGSDSSKVVWIVYYYIMDTVLVSTEN